MIEVRVSTGIDPLYVGEAVREGIEQDWPYIFTDNEFEPLHDASKVGAALKAAGDCGGMPKLTIASAVPLPIHRAGNRSNGGDNQKNASLSAWLQKLPMKPTRKLQRNSSPERSK